MFLFAALATGLVFAAILLFHYALDVISSYNGAWWTYLASLYCIVAGSVAGGMAFKLFVQVARYTLI